jgi:polysaccharide biosynthesis protein PslH
LVIPSVTVPIGIDTREYHPDWTAFDKPLRLSFIGALDWMPNIEGLDWFIHSVWEPLVRVKYPDLELHIAGRNASKRLLNLQVPGIVIHGEVPDAAQFLNQYPVTIAPLLSGGGMRVKILEGMALGRVVLSTSVGIEGIPAVHQRESLIADTPEAWLEAIDWCHARATRLRIMGERAQTFCHDQFDNLEIAAHLISAYRENRQDMLHKVV